MTGPLAGVRVIELSGMGPGPFAAMVLADAGADVLRVDRPRGSLNDDPLAGGRDANPINRGRRSIVLDLKVDGAREFLLDLVARADVIIEGFRPGVVERLGVGPTECLALNPRLVYGRVTGWGQSGPLSMSAGHDINYVALSGALGTIGMSDGPPVPPLNLLGDYGGGLLLAYGITAALFQSARSGVGQVVDSAMVDAAAYLSTYVYGLLGQGRWNDRRQSNSLDGAAPFYRTYRTADDKFIAVGAIELRFLKQLATIIGVTDVDLSGPLHPDEWESVSAKFEAAFATHTRAEWEALFDQTDACATPVLSLAEAPLHPHNEARNVFVTIDGMVQPSPAPRFLGTPGEISRVPAPPGTDGSQALADWGVDDARVNEARSQGFLGML
jgi:alpha-methylacyl-CoA racemase